MVPDSLHREAHDVLHELEALGAELVEQWLQKTLPGRRIVIEDMLSQDDIVAARLTVDGKHQAFCFVRIADRKIAETWHNFGELKG
jgi:predicted ester cyclase